jgi:hypothetical protein
MLCEKEGSRDPNRLRIFLAGGDMKKDRDQRQFFKDLGATAEQTVEEVRGVEENYFGMMQKTMIPLPWIADLNAKLQSYAEQHLAAALEFAHKLSLAKDFQDLARIQAEFFQNRMQSLGEQTNDLAEAYTKSAASAIKGSFGLFSKPGDVI